MSLTGQSYRIVPRRRETSSASVGLRMVSSTAIVSISWQMPYIDADACVPFCFEHDAIIFKYFHPDVVHVKRHGGDRLLIKLGSIDVVSRRDASDVSLSSYHQYWSDCRCHWCDARSDGLLDSSSATMASSFNPFYTTHYRYLLLTTRQRPRPTATVSRNASRTRR